MVHQTYLKGAIARKIKGLTAAVQDPPVGEAMFKGGIIFKDREEEETPHFAQSAHWVVDLILASKQVKFDFLYREGNL